MVTRFFDDDLDVDTFVMEEDPDWGQLQAAFSAKEINAWVEKQAGEELGRRNSAANAAADTAEAAGRKAIASAEAAIESRKAQAVAWSAGADSSAAAVRAAIDRQTPRRATLTSTSPTWLKRAWSTTV
jgi:hypothetical protein